MLPPLSLCPIVSALIVSMLAAPVEAAKAEPAGTSKLDTPAPLDAFCETLPGASARWVTDPEFGGRIYMLQSGQGTPRPGTPPLVLIHGLGEAGLRDFHPILKQLGEKRRVISFDLPGFGRSTKANEEYSPARYALVTRAIIDHYAGGFADVVGHSMGGAIALAFAGTYPQQVRRLVLVDAAGILHREAFVTEQIHGSMDTARGLLPGTVAAVEDFAGKWLRRVRTAEPPAEFIVHNRLLRQHALGGQPGRIAALALITTNLGPAIAGVTAPTLILWGSDDHIAPLRTAQLLADRLAHAHLTVLQGVGHVAMSEAPDKTIAALRAHLDGPEPSTPVILQPETQGDYLCKNQNDVALQGRFDTITLYDCARVALTGVVAKKLVLRHSSALAVATRVLEGIDADDSLLTMTGGAVLGTPPLRLAESRLDLAGVRLGGPLESAVVISTSRVLCSVCTIESPGPAKYAHGEQVLAPSPKR